MGISSRDAFLLTLASRLALLIAIPLAISFIFILFYQFHFIIRVLLIIATYSVLAAILYRFFWNELGLKSRIHFQLMEQEEKVIR